MSYTLEDIKKSRIVVIAMWFIYSSAYFGRTCYSTAMVAIVGEGVYSKAAIGAVGSAFFFCYGAGQLVSGFLGDRVNPFKMVLVGAGMSSVCCLAMSFAPSVAVMAVIWGANGIFQSMLWSPVLRIFSEIINPKLRKKAALNIALSLPVGTILSYLCSTLVLKSRGWHTVFVCGSAVIMLFFVAGLISYLYIKKGLIPEKRQQPTEESHEKKPFGMALAVQSGLVIILIASFLHGMLRDGIANWVPTMLRETYDVSASFSVFLTIALPVFNAFGAYAVTPVYKSFHENEMKTVAVFAPIAVVPLLLLLSGKLPVVASVIMLALTTSTMYALNYLIITRVPMRFSFCSKTSTVTGILNSAAYIGCAVSSYGFGAVSQRFGWSVTIIIWLSAVLLISISALLSMKKWKRFINPD